ncbi:unnamed protein product [Tilletia laevis]|nr:hypothetical protein CF335_g8891 [Tilletia laevis]CAD6887985.1 unnamed protein product [Tilletia caries]CAD6906538.1 unnamed protein product [Tilletia laevis]CAD6937158.1 unnamed protein product [Tilletia controversa]
MFVLVRLSPPDSALDQSDFFLHPLLAPEHLDDFSLPLPFSVDAQAQLRLEDGQPVIYCQHRRSDVLHNALPATKTPRRVHTGDILTVLSSDNPTTVSVRYAVQVAFFSFSADLRAEVNVELQRLQSASVLALQAQTSPHFPLALPLHGKLPTPAPDGTNWDGVRDLIKTVQSHSFQNADQDRTRDGVVCASSSSALSNLQPPPSLESPTYAQLIANESSAGPASSSSPLVSPSSSSSSSGSPLAATFSSAGRTPSESTGSSPPSPLTSVLPSSGLVDGTSSKTSLPASVFISSSGLLPSATAQAGSIREVSTPGSPRPCSPSAPVGASSSAFGPSSNPARYATAQSAASRMASTLSLVSAETALARVRQAWLMLRYEVLHSELSVNLVRAPGRDQHHHANDAVDPPPAVQHSPSDTIDVVLSRVRRALTSCIAARTDEHSASPMTVPETTSAATSPNSSVPLPGFDATSYGSPSFPLPGFHSYPPPPFTPFISNLWQSLPLAAIATNITLLLSGIFNPFGPHPLASPCHGHLPASHHW